MANNVKDEDATLLAMVAKFPDKNGFEKGYTFRKIVGATNPGNKTHFWVQFYESNEIELIPSVVANKNIPYEVIKFYEKYLVLYDHDTQ